MPTNARDLVATASRILADQGLDDLIWGHASMRDADSGGYWIKSAEWGLGEVDSDGIHLLDPSGNLLTGTGTPHSEYPIHAEILAARPDVGAVVHAHPPHAVALAAAGQRLLPVSHAANMFVPPEVPRFAQTADLVLTPELGKEVAATLGDSSAMFLVNHGIVAVGPDIQTATVRAVLLERACQQQLLTRGFGGWPTWSDPEESAAKRAHIYHERAVGLVWDHLARRIAP